MNEHGVMLKSLLERLGTGDPPQLDIAVDPIDGTRPLALGTWNSIATVALAPRGTMFDPGPAFYMYKIAVGPEARDAIDLNAPVVDNLRNIARVKGEDVEDLTVVILDRPRHEKLIAEIRETIEVPVEKSPTPAPSPPLRTQAIPSREPPPPPQDCERSCC